MRRVCNDTGGARGKKMTARTQRIQEVRVSAGPAWSWPRPADAVSRLAAERLEEEQQEGNQQHVNDERLDQDETQDQRASYVAGRAGVTGDRFGGRAHRLALAQRGKSGRDAESETSGDDRPLRDLEIDRLRAGTLREYRREHPTREDQYECQNETFTHDPNLL